MRDHTQFIHLVGAFIVFASLCARAATTYISDQRDGQVLQALLLHLLADPEFGMAKVPTNGAVILLHTRTPEKTGFLQAHQMRTDVGGHRLPGDAERDLRRRNTPPDAKPDTYHAVAASFTNLTFGTSIVVTNLTAMWGSRHSYSCWRRRTLKRAVGRRRICRVTPTMARALLFEQVSARRLTEQWSQHCWSGLVTSG